jgi:D-arabinose 1-dehydrogenase-like Zn-dependent alcohol dehydrogenase
MRVAQVTRFGPPEVLVTARRPDPVPGPRDVVIAVAAADTLWVETLIRSGAGQDVWPMRPPYVPGGAVAGRVVAVGDEVEPGSSGRAVVAHVRTDGRPEGGYAEQAVVPVETLVDVPDGLPLTVAAAVLHDGPTALALFDLTRIGASDTVLVVGASGGLGIVSVQLARARAKRVVATARGAAKLEQVRRLGARRRSRCSHPVAGSPRTARPAAGSRRSIRRRRNAATSGCSASVTCNCPTSSVGGTPRPRSPRPSPARSRRSSARPSPWTTRRRHTPRSRRGRCSARRC